MSEPQHVPPEVPRRRSFGRRLVGRWGLKALGWKITGALPAARKQVIIVAPHTSNWDFVVGFFAYLALELDATWFGKHTLFRWPMGPVLRYFGGIPVDRRGTGNLVHAYVEEFDRRERMLLALAPEGTRTRVVEWKRGFYHIAVGAHAVIAPVALDYSERTVRLMEAITPTGEADGEIATLRMAFRSDMARFPQQYGA